MKQKQGPFHPLRIEAVPCNMDIAQEHLAAFTQSFVRYDRRERAKHILFHLSLKRPHRHLCEISNMLDERYTTPPQPLPIQANLPTHGVYFAGGNEAWQMSLSDAETAQYLGQDAIWSAIAGSYAVFLHHENMQWICYRGQST